MRKFKTYNVYILFVLLLLTVTLFGIALYMRPVEGNLTRLGGYLSNDFAMNDVRMSFKKPLFRLAKDIDDYDHYYDVVVIGDSFSRDFYAGWQNFLVNNTGLSLLTFDIQKISFAEIIGAPMYKKQPPRVFIYESVEYAVTRRNSFCSSNNEDVYETNNMLPISISPLGAQMVDINPLKPGISSGDFDFDAAANYLYKAIVRNTVGLNITQARKYKLSNHNLFSNSDKESILFHFQDFSKLKIHDDKIKTSICSLLEIQNAVEKNKATKFLFLPIPDKLSSYSNYLQDQSFKDISIIHKFDNSGLNMVRADDYVSNAISDGITDVYLPDDTHFSYKGYDLVSLAVCEYLIDNGVFSYNKNDSGKTNCAVKFK